MRCYVPSMAKLVEVRSGRPSLVFIFTTGVIAAFIVSLFIATGIWMHWFPTPAGAGPITWILGLFLHLLMGGGFALIYSALFRSLAKSGAATGAVIGFFHWVVVGILISLLLGPSNRAYWIMYGRPTFFSSLTLHLLFGAIVGGFHRFAIQANRKQQTLRRSERAA